MSIRMRTTNSKAKIAQLENVMSQKNIDMAKVNGDLQALNVECTKLKMLIPKEPEKQEDEKDNAEDGPTENSEIVDKDTTEPIKVNGLNYVYFDKKTQQTYFGVLQCRGYFEVETS